MIFSLADYLDQSELLNFFPLENASRLYFHWADADFGREQVIEKIKGKKNLGPSSQRLRERMYELKNVYLWIKSEGIIKTTTLWQIYEDALLRQVGKQTLPFSLPEMIDVSTIGPQGPYRATSLYHLLNFDIYRMMALEKVMKGELPERDFRIRCQTTVICAYGEGLKNSFPVEICQITMKGLLLKMNHEYWERAKFSTHLGLLLETSPFMSGNKLELQELFRHLSSHALSPFFTSDQKKMCLIELSTVRHLVGQGVWQGALQTKVDLPHYLFIPYQRIVSEGNEVAETLTSFTTNLRDELIKKAS